MNLYPVLDDQYIQDRDTGSIVRWKRNWAQEEYVSEFHRQWNRGRPVRIIILKARQLGISTATGGIGYALTTIIPDFPGLIIAHEMDGSEHLLGISKRFHETGDLARLYKPKYLSRKHLAWENRSSLQVVTAKNEAATRSRTLRFVHGSEAGFWDNARVLMLGLKQTVPTAPHTFIAIESTGNGIGNYFYETWHKAVAGQNEYIPLFFPWWRHYEYRASWARRHYVEGGEHPNLVIEGRELDQETSFTMLNHEGRLPDLTGEEKQLRQMMLLGQDGRGVMDIRDVWDALIWRRWAIATLADGDVEGFHQEYPSYPEEAFIASGSNVFPFQKLIGCYDRHTGIRGRLTRDTTTPGGVRFQEDSTGPLTVYSYPSKDWDWGVYHVGGDPSGTTRGDHAVIQVINRRTYEQVAVWRARCDPGSFAEELAKVGHFYNRAMIAPEVTGPGQETIGRLIESGYPHLWRNRWADRMPGIIASTYGFPATQKTKDWFVGHLLKLIVDGDIVIHDSTTFTEMRNYVTMDKGGYGNSNEEEFDDCVTSLGICCLTASTEPPLPPYGEVSGPMGLPKQAGREVYEAEFWEEREEQMDAARVLQGIVRH